MFDNLPLHPVAVHLPIGLMLILPLITVFATFLLSKRFINRNSLVILVFLHALLIGSSYIALETGEDEEHKVEKIVAEHIIEDHEERAETFMIGSIVVFFISLSLIIPWTTSLTKLSMTILLVAQLALLFLGYRVGHSGGQLVYVHGAAEAYTTKQRLLDNSINKAGEVKNEAREIESEQED